MSEQAPVPVSALNIVHEWDERELHVPPQDEVLPWDLALERLDAGRLYWHVSHDEHRAHVRPVFAVVCDGVLCSSSSATARKTTRLALDARVTLATSTDDMDIVYEGVATFVDDVARAERIASAYRQKYGWPVEVTGSAAFDAPFGAPSAGPPPYLVYAVEPVTVRGFGTDEALARRSTRWDFDR